MHSKNIVHRDLKP
jgi:serine/threonine protein kinase